MSIKEQVEFAKEELTQDEKLLAGLIKVERFYKRNRIAILVVAAAIVVGGIGYGVMDYLKTQQLRRANAALLTLQKNPADKAAMQTLEKENPALASLFMLRRATQTGDVKRLAALSHAKDGVVADLAKYHLAVFKKDAAAIRDYRMQSGALLKDFALFDEAYLLMKKNRVAEARERLAMIGENSPLRNVARMLGHFGITAAKPADKGAM